MTTSPTSEQAARQVLTILVEKLEARPGHSLAASNLQVSWPGDWSGDDLAHGLQYGIAQGWIEESGINIHLTEAGFAEVR